MSPQFHSSRKSCFNQKRSRWHKGWVLIFFLTGLFLITLPLCETKPCLYNIAAKDASGVTRDCREGRIWKVCRKDHSVSPGGAVLILPTTVSALSNSRVYMDEGHRSAHQYPKGTNCPALLLSSKKRACLWLSTPSTSLTWPMALSFVYGYPVQLLAS